MILNGLQTGSLRAHTSKRKHRRHFSTPEVDFKTFIKIFNYSHPIIAFVGVFIHNVYLCFANVSACGWPTRWNFPKPRQSEGIEKPTSLTFYRRMSRTHTHTYSQFECYPLIFTRYFIQSFSQKCFSLFFGRAFRKVYALLGAFRCGMLFLLLL